MKKLPKDKLHKSLKTVHLTSFSFFFLKLYAEKVATRGLCAIAQAESLRYKLLGGLAVRR